MASDNMQPELCSMASSVPRHDVSVVIPCFNAGRYLADAVKSVLAQTEPPAEIIVVDDKSTDKSVDVARSFGGAVRLVESGANSGRPGVPKDIGLDEARSEFVAFLDADDVWVPRKLELQMPKFRDSEVGLVYGRAQTFRSGHPPQGAPWPPALPAGNVLVDFYFACCAPNSTVIARRAALVKAGGFDRDLEILGEDYDLWLKVAFSWKVEACPEVLMLYREHTGQMTRQRMVQARAHLEVESRHALAFRAATGMSEEDRRRRAVERLMGHINVAFYNERNLRLARQLLELLNEAFPEIESPTRRVARRLYAMTFLPAAIFRLRDMVSQ
jgi:glycosyltransferase involved in cell wall biosynthesis